MEDEAKTLSRWLHRQSPTTVIAHQCSLGEKTPNGTCECALTTIILRMYAQKITSSNQTSYWTLRRDNLLVQWIPSYFVAKSIWLRKMRQKSRSPSTKICTII